MKHSTFSKREISRLRELARRKRDIANDPVTLERKQAWYNHDEGKNSRVMVLAEHEGVCDKNKPLPDNACQCEDKWAKGIESRLLNEIYCFDTLKDDHVIEASYSQPWELKISGYGVDAVRHHAESDGGKGAFSWDAPIKNINKDFHLLKPRTYEVDRELSIAKRDYLNTVFDGIISVENHSGFWWTLGLTIRAIDLIGLENLMLFMYDDPEGLHRLMSFLRDDHMAFARWLEYEGLLGLNNKNHYIGSGSMGYTRRLPQKDFKAGSNVRMKDQWVLLESQETVMVGPDQFEEFIFPYQQDIAKEFGLLYYGCCEPVHNRWHILEKMPNIERVSVSPWCDEELISEKLGRRYVYSRKPNPAQISTAVWDENLIRQDLRRTLTAARGCRIEIIMKDVHTLNNEPERLARWVEIAFDEIGLAGR
jgi:hypothetical protein